MVRAMGPLIGMILWMKKGLPTPDSALITREDLAALADIGEAEGAIAENEEKVIINVLNLGNVQVREIMTPRVVVQAWPDSYSVRQAVDNQTDTRFNRVPLYGDSLDDLKGFVLRTEILTAAAHGEWDRNLMEFIKEPLLVHPDHSAERLLGELITNQSHIAFVQDEFGGTSGIVTLEDAIETLIGEEIVDEADDVADRRALARQQNENNSVDQADAQPDRADT
jgi:CBS domain containing-hemolysin-like protein